MRGDKQLSRARVDGEARARDDRQTRRRHCPRVGSAGTCKPKYTKVRRGEQVTADVVEGDAIDWLIADRSAGALKICPSRTPGAAVGSRVVRHQEDVAGLWRLSAINDQFVVAQIRDVSMIGVRRVNRDTANGAVRRVRIERVEPRKRDRRLRIRIRVLRDKEASGGR